MSLIDLLILFLLGLISSRCFKELFRVAGNYIIGHKHVGVGNPQAHNGQLATFPSLADTPTLRVEAPRTRQTQKATSLWPGDPPNRDPYVPVYKLFFPKVPAEAPGKKQFFRTVVPSRVFELGTCNPYVPVYKLFFPKVPAEAPGKKHFFRTVVPSRVFELGTCNPYVPVYKLFFPKVPAEEPGKKQFFRTVVPSRVFELGTCNPYVPVYKLFFPKVPAEEPGKKQFFRTVVPSRVFELGTCNPYVPAYTLFFKNRELYVHDF